MVTVTDIIRAPQDQRISIRNELVIDRMKMDKTFSIFLDTTDLRDSDPDTDEWRDYKTMMDHYTNVSSLIKIAEYYIANDKRYSHF
jgi:hypothetical protein